MSKDVNKEVLFGKTLTAVKKKAKEQGNVISEKEVEEAFRELDGVQAAEGSVFTDVIYQNGEDGAKLVANLNSITEQVNQLEITAGRMPQAPDECVVDADMYSEEVIGTQIILAQENKEETMDMLAYDTYTVVGVAMSPTYMNFQRGSSSIGSGVVSGFIYIPIDAFTTDYYTEIYLKMDVDEPLYSKEYDDYIGARNDAVEEELRIQAEYRRQVVVDEAQAELGFLSALVNNAGVAQQKLFTDITDGDWDTMIGIHLGGTFRCCRAVLPEMIRRRHGTILNISSMWGQIGGSCEVHYSAAKAGVIGLTKALAKEVGLSGVTVNCVAPGVIRTAMLDGFTEEDLASLAEETPVGRLGTPEDVADLLVFLAGDSARFITGQVIGVNGGFVV